MVKMGVILAVKPQEKKEQVNCDNEEVIKSRN
jgi:hypothetical protein